MMQGHGELLSVRTRTVRFHRSRLFARAALIALLCSSVLSTAAPVLALPIPSKTAQDQSLADREAELSAIRSVLERDDVARTLAQHGLTANDVHERLAQLSPEELDAFSSQLDQIQAAGVDVPRYIWYLLAGLLGVLIVTAIF